MVKKTVSENLLHEWENRHAAGESLRKIARTCDFSYQTISSRLKEAGIVVDKSRSLSFSLKGKQSHRKGVRATQETIDKMSAARKGKPGKTGYKFTDAQKNKMSESRKAYIRNNYEKFISDQRKSSRKKLDDCERVARVKARQSMKQMLRRILTMTRARKDAKTEVIIGYTKHQLIEHIEKQFKEGMSWADRSTFHIDHIIPVDFYLKQGITDPAIICALSNLQPLTPEDNRKKGNSTDRAIVSSF